LGCFATEVFSSALSVHSKGSNEAATALGMGTFEKFYRIILPAGFGELLYLGLGIYFLVFLKDTALGVWLFG